MGTATLSDPTRIARLFHALADETRLDILAQLTRGERCVCELTGALDAAQSRLSFHLKTLKEAGLVADRRQGRWVYYRIRAEALDRIAAAVEVLRPRMVEERAAEPCC